jgi:hypothetical protein
LGNALVPLINNLDYRSFDLFPPKSFFFTVLAATLILGIPLSLVAGFIGRQTSPRYAKKVVPASQ